MEAHSAVLPQSMPVRMTSVPEQSSLQIGRQVTAYRGQLEKPSSELVQESNAEDVSDDEHQKRRKNNPWRKLAKNLRGFVDEFKDFADDVVEGWEELFAHGKGDKHCEARTSKGRHHAHHHAHHHGTWPQQHMHPNLAQTMPPAMMAEYFAMQGRSGPMPYDLQHYSCPPGFAVPASPLPSSAPLSSSPEMMPFTTIPGSQSGNMMQPQQWQASLPPTAGASPLSLQSSSPQHMPQQAPLGSMGSGALGNYMPAPEAGAYQSLPPPSSGLLAPVGPPSSMPLGMPQPSSAGMPQTWMGSLPPGSMGSLPPYAAAPQSPSWHSAPFVSAF